MTTAIFDNAQYEQVRTSLRNGAEMGNYLLQASPENCTTFIHAAIRYQPVPCWEGLRMVLAEAGIEHVLADYFSEMLNKPVITEQLSHLEPLVKAVQEKFAPSFSKAPQYIPHRRLSATA